MTTQPQKNYALARNIIIYDELKKVLTAFNAASIKVIVIAGAALAETVYPHIGLRPMSDIDLLVHETDLPAIGKTLAPIGYVLEISRNDERHYHNPDPALAIHTEIDTHTRLSYLDESDLSAVWARAIKTNLADVETLVLSPENTLIDIAADALVHHARLSEASLNDMSLVIKGSGEKLNWSLVIRLIKQYHLEVPVYYALSAVKEQTRITIPQWVLRTIRPVGGHRWFFGFYKFALEHRLPLGDDITPVLRFITRPQRFKLLLDAFLPSAGFMKPRYGLSSRGLTYLYYPVRILSLCWRVVKVAARIALAWRQASRDGAYKLPSST